MKTIKECGAVVREVLKELGFKNSSNTVEKRGLCVVNASTHEKIFFFTDDDYKNVDIDVFVRRVDREDGSVAVAAQIGYTLQFDCADEDDPEARIVSQKNFWSRDFYNFKKEKLLEEIRNWLKENYLNLYYGE
jgi:hypothetical protein